MSRSPQRWGPAVAWALLILIATSVPIPAALAAIPPSGSDKVVHIGMYAALAWLTARALDGSSRRAALVAVAMVSLFGAIDEWHQQLIPGRSRDVADWIADTIGAAVGAMAFQAARRRREFLS